MTTTPVDKMVRITPELREAAAIRLVGDRAAASAIDRTTAARRFLASAPGIGIDLSLMWGMIDGATGEVRQVCLAVMGTGRTVSLFVSGPGRRGGGARRRGSGGGSGGAEEPEGVALGDRVALINEACRAAAEPGAVTGSGARLAQALLETEEEELRAAFEGAGFIRLGELAYLRRSTPRSAQRPEPALPAGLVLRSMAEIRDDRALARALERSYVNTLDCPELAGIRDIGDVIQSHRAVGRHDPNLWWVLMEEGTSEPIGCVLMSPVPDQDAVELVYLGIAESARARGVGSALLRIALNRIAGRPERWVMCAVDTRNPPALRLYERAGFSEFSSRVPLIRRIGAR